MKTFLQTFAHWIPFVFAVFLCYTALWRLAASETKIWAPVFYAFLPMCFFFIGVTTARMEREIRELRRSVAKLEARAKPDNVAA